MLTELRLLPNVRVIVPLGKIAFDTILRLLNLAMPLPRPLPRFGHGVLSTLPNGLFLLPAYHPSQQNTQTGRLTQPMWYSVFATARAVLDAMDQPDPGPPSPRNSDL